MTIANDSPSSGLQDAVLTIPLKLLRAHIERRLTLVGTAETVTGAAIHKLAQMGFFFHAETVTRFRAFHAETVTLHR